MTLYCIGLQFAKHLSFIFFFLSCPYGTYGRIQFGTTNLQLHCVMLVTHNKTFPKILWSYDFCLFGIFTATFFSVPVNSSGSHCMQKFTVQGLCCNHGEIQLLLVKVLWFSIYKLYYKDKNRQFTEILTLAQQVPPNFTLFPFLKTHIFPVFLSHSLTASNVYMLHLPNIWILGNDRSAVSVLLMPRKTQCELIVDT